MHHPERDLHGHGLLRPPVEDRLPPQGLERLHAVSRVVHPAGDAHQQQVAPVGVNQPLLPPRRIATARGGYAACAPESYGSRMRQGTVMTLGSPG